MLQVDSSSVHDVETDRKYLGKLMYRILLY